MLHLWRVVLSVAFLLLPTVFGGLLDIKKGPIVHLFEWKYTDIATECEQFLAPKGFAGIQISPPSENLVAPGRPWWERYQIVSYKLESRSGNRAQLEDMLRRCNKVGVRVFADAVMNHMTGDFDHCKGTGESDCNPKDRHYPGVPYSRNDFHWPACQVNNYNDAREVRVCEIVGLHDLDQSKEYVRKKLVGYLNSLIDIGFAGVRVDAAKHMYPSDLKVIYSRMNNLNTAHGFAPNTRPFIYQEVLDPGNQAVKYEEYTGLGLITDQRYSIKINECFNEGKPLSSLRQFGSEWLAPDYISIVYVENHDSEREGHAINYKQSRAYKMAVAFMLAWGRGYPLILSSYKFDNFNDGPPADNWGNTMSPNPGQDNVCKNGKWVCQHRWRQIFSMVAFNRATYGLPVSNWWDNGKNQIAFSRGNKGFIALNKDGYLLDKKLQTGLPAGKYCDVISGLRVGQKCEGTTVEVDASGEAQIFVKAFNEHDHSSDGVLAIFDHESSRLVLPNVLSGPPNTLSHPLSGNVFVGSPNPLSLPLSGTVFVGHPNPISLPISGNVFVGPPNSPSLPSSRNEFGGPPNPPSLPSSSGGTLDIKKGPIVHLFEWKYTDIAKECEQFLAPKGFAGIQISPPTENLVAPGRPWWERYQIVSYKLESRSGNRAQLEDMLRRCNKVGVRVFADAVMNHMTGDFDHCKGTGGSDCNPNDRHYPGVPYSRNDFHWPACKVNNYNDAREVRVCEIVGLHDLDQSKEYVRNKLVGYLNSLIDIGFAGVRVDAAKHMYPSDLKVIYSRMKNLNTAHGFCPNTRPFIYQEVLDPGNQGVHYEEYTGLGLITDQRYSLKINECFNEGKQLSSLRQFGKDWLAPDDISVVYVENHDSEREGHAINYKQARAYKMAVAFMLAWGRGYPLILSSYKFDNFNEGPPADNWGNTMSPNPGQDNICKNGKWVCQHRWLQIYSMVAFNRATHGLPVSNWWDNGQNQIAFSRGNKGFVAFNKDSYPLDKKLKTNLPKGKYCDVISGLRVGQRCEGTMVEVDASGEARIFIKAFNAFDYSSDGVLAIFDQETSRLS